VTPRHQQLHQQQQQQQHNQKPFRLSPLPGNDGSNPASPAMKRHASIETFSTAREIEGLQTAQGIRKK